MSKAYVLYRIFGGNRRYLREINPHTYRETKLTIGADYVENRRKALHYTCLAAAETVRTFAGGTLCFIEEVEIEEAAPTIEQTTTIKARLHRGGFEESKATTTTIKNRQELVLLLLRDLPKGTPAQFADFSFELYSVDPDPRIAWENVWAVFDMQRRIIAFCSGDPCTLPEAAL